MGLSPDAGHPPYGSPGLPGFLGVSHAAFRPNGPTSGDMVLKDVAAGRLDDRRDLLRRLDVLRRDIDASRSLAGMDALTQTAFDILTSSRLAKAIDISEEPQRVRDRYGKGDPKNYGDGAPRKRGFATAHFDSLTRLEDWAESHPTHLRIFGRFIELATELKGDIKLKLWHEVTVVPAEMQEYEYVNCHPGTGMMPYASASPKTASAV